MQANDPMGPDAGRVLLNGNAETTARFCALAVRAAGADRHRDPAHRAAGRVVLITASWGRGELGDDGLRRAFAALGRHRVGNLALRSAMVAVLRERPVIRDLLAEHEAAWVHLKEAYAAENDALIHTLRGGWERARHALGVGSLRALLSGGDRHAPGPPTRPVQHLIEHALSQQVQRLVEALVRADDRHALDLRELWDHFHLAAGLQFDPLWQQHRQRIASDLLGASLITLTGGDPVTLLTALRFFRLDDLLLEAVRRGAHVFGSSAGAMVLGQRVVIFHDRRRPRQEFLLLGRGVGLARGVQPFPHVTDRLQVDDPFNLAYLSARFRHRLCVGLNAGSTLALQPSGGRWQFWSAGDEDVVLFGPDGNKLRVPPGKRIITSAGPP